jgi:hypothetical protein
MSTLTAKIKEELYAMLPPTLFFFIALHLVAFIRILMLKGTGIPLGTSVSVTVAALVLGKSVVIADMLRIINRFPQKPLAYNIVWKTLLYFLVAMLVHYLERLIDFWRQAGSFIAGNEKLLAEIVWPHFWAIQIVLLMLITMYCTMSELNRVLGRDTMRHLFFGPTPLPGMEEGRKRSTNKVTRKK